MAIFFSSDYHFNHQKEFIYKPRGFNSIYDMNEAIVERHNKIVTSEDVIYVLGDLCLGGGSDEALKINKKIISSLKGNLKVILGNHDTHSRIQMYNECWNVEVLGYADMLKYGKYHFYLSHYPTLTTNFDDDKPLKARTLNLYGHTHQSTNFYNNNPCMYHVGVDSHYCEPVSIDTIVEEIKQQHSIFSHISS